jgi:hypothetical protein
MYYVSPPRRDLLPATPRQRGFLFYTNDWFTGHLQIILNVI